MKNNVYIIVYVQNKKNKIAPKAIKYDSSLLKGDEELDIPPYDGISFPSKREAMKYIADNWE